MPQWGGKCLKIGRFGKRGLKKFNDQKILKSSLVGSSCVEIENN